MKRMITMTCALVGLMAGTASAELLAGYAPGTETVGRVAIGEYGFGGAYPAQQAMSFQTGSEAYYLGYVDIADHVYLDYGNGSLQLALHEDNGSAPGSVVSGAGNLLSPIAPAIAIVLEANKSYWFVASADQSGGDTRYWWDLTSSGTFASDVAGTDLPLTYASNADGSWTTYTGAGLMMSVHGSVIPEPGSVALTGLGMGVLWMARRRKNRRGSEKAVRCVQTAVHSRSFLCEERNRRI